MLVYNETDELITFTITTRVDTFLGLATLNVQHVVPPGCFITLSELGLSSRRYVNKKPVKKSKRFAITHKPKPERP